MVRIEQQGDGSLCIDCGGRSLVLDQPSPPLLEAMAQPRATSILHGLVDAMGDRTAPVIPGGYVEAVLLREGLLNPPPLHWRRVRALSFSAFSRW